jgi:putative lipoic acid-binding regulatory protein
MSVTERLKKLLEERHEGPFMYPFKFVMPLSSVEEFSRMIPGIETKSRLSSGSKYVSISFDFQAQNAQEVVDIYHRVQAVPGILSL